MSFKIENNHLVSVNPATDEVVGQLPITSQKEVFQAVEKSRQAFLEWSLMSFENRADLLTQGLKKLQEISRTIGILISQEMGKPLNQALGEASYSPIHAIENIISQARQAQTSTILKEDNRVTTLHYVPRGVVAVITPWNFPVNLSINALIPALLTGNSVVYKPSENTPLTGDLMTKTLAGFLPDGVLNIIHGDGKVGKALTEANIDMVAFVGSQSTGKRIMKAQAEKLNPVILEMGGKDAMIVLKDADLEKSAKYAVQGSLRNSGQVCVSVERIFVDESIAPQFENRVAELMNQYIVGQPDDPATQMGPMVSRNQREIVLSQLEDARKKGASISGGNILHEKGIFIQPALVTQVHDDMQLMQEETFGPVIAIQRVKSPSEALQKANQLPYGLGGSVWGRDEELTSKIASRMEAGMIGINQGAGGVTGAPFVGNKQSTVGHFGGVDGVRLFTQIRSITQQVN